MFELNIGNYVLIAMMAMAISMAIIPLMIRLAPVIGMIDAPDPRKVHSIPIPRVGGLGIVIGALIPMLLWLPYTDLTLAYFLGAAVLLAFGTWDDIAELGHYVKFAGQFLAAGLVVYYGDLYVAYFPFNNFDTIPESIGRPFTVIAIVGMINAINHSDGLDGLAGGESLISLGVLIYFSMIFDNDLMMVIAVATVGGIFGFLRFNSHPARVFMGDGGSQFLGFTLAVLAILLTQRANTTISPALPLLVLGLPIIDILAVFFLRAKNKMNLFRATRNHIHHRLLDLGLYHYESVMVIYTVQMILVLLSVPLMYEMDITVTLTYAGICTAVFVFLTVSEKKGIKFHSASKGREEIIDKLIRVYPQIKDIPIKLIDVGLSLFIISSALVVYEIPRDFGIISLILVSIFIFMLVTRYTSMLLYRLILFVTIGFSVYLISSYPVSWLKDELDLIFIYFIMMVITGFIAVKITKDIDFKITPLDYLVVAIAVLIEFIPGENELREHVIWMTIQIIVLFYLCEMLIINMHSKLNRFSGYVVLALLLIAYRGLA
jgi:UDP-GlcNAc:undecaprenyl-phosphate GlcNAc-1-phosphate transferase